MNLANDPILPKLKTQLEKLQQKNSKEFYAWKIVNQEEVSLQTLMLGHAKVGLESYQIRDVTDQALVIEIFTRHGEPMMMGNASFVIDPLADLEMQVQKTFNNSLMVNNRPWDLPTKANGTYENVLTSDPLIAENLQAANERLINEASQKVKTLKGVNVNSAELFLKYKKSYFEMSTGLKGTSAKSDIYFEIALEKLPLPNTQEVLKYKNAISIEDANLSQFIDEVVEETLSITDTILPKTSDDACLLVDCEVISNLVDDLVAQLDAGREYDKSTFMKKGDSVIKGTKRPGSDKLCITMDPTVPVMAKTMSFTSEGMKPVKARVVENDSVVTQLVNNRIGQYLKKESNFIDGNHIVTPGNFSKIQLLNSIGDRECIEVLSFSSLLINPHTLTWSSEIKLGRLWKKGKVVAMVKGGVASGDIKENFTNFRFTNEIKKKNKTGGGFSSARGYQGPGHMLIQSGVKIAGE